MYDREFTPNFIKELKENEIFVFGSNLKGMHGGGVDEFIAYASQHPEYKFLVTRIACGIAGFSVQEIAPLFEAAIDVENIILPKDFVENI